MTLIGLLAAEPSVGTANRLSRVLLGPGVYAFMNASTKTPQIKEEGTFTTRVMAWKQLNHLLTSDEVKPSSTLATST